MVDACVFWCHYLDKVLSALFMKAPSLPKLMRRPIYPIYLDSSPSSAVIRFMGHMAYILETALDVQLQPRELSNNEQSAAVLDRLIRDTNEKSVSYETQPCASEVTNKDRIAAGFCYHTLLNNLFQTRVRLLQEDEDQKRCLDSGRNALTTFLELQSHAIDSDSSRPNASFLTWTILLFPLRLFFCLFCNVVQTSDTRDMQLMQSVARALDLFKKTIKPAAKLHRLFVTLLDLCGPLFQSSAAGSDSSTIAIDYSTVVDSLSFPHECSAPGSHDVSHVDTNERHNPLPKTAEAYENATVYPAPNEDTGAILP
ncbi:hypothetical protein BBP40_007647 [Aspergillus hancockii]|nr:hypothetical protein BBP40_007647 [Aspergillus hancockii]